MGLLVCVCYSHDDPLVSYGTVLVLGASSRNLPPFLYSLEYILPYGK